MSTQTENASGVWVLQCNRFNDGRKVRMSLHDSLQTAQTFALKVQNEDANPIALEWQPVFPDGTIWSSQQFEHNGEQCYWNVTLFGVHTLAEVLSEEVPLAV